MKRIRLAIIHFQPLEKYPPVMNFITSAEATKQLDVLVLTTKKGRGGRLFTSGAARIIRVARQGAGAAMRYWNYLKFNCLSFLQLVLNKPEAIMYFETYSAFPALMFKRIFPGTRLFIHYHEYTSPAEYGRSSGYVRWLHRLERGMYKTAERISHTNKDRLRLFLEDHKSLQLRNTDTMANYPPASWYNGTGKNARNSSGTVRMVYAGALSMDTMHTESLVSWVIQQTGKYTLDIYTDNLTEEAGRYLAGIKSGLIDLKTAVSYFDLPSVLAQYDIGLVIYNGHIPNYVYNVPNKVFEYLACGLEVWCSADLLSVEQFKQEENIEQIKVVDFRNLEDEKPETTSSQKLEHKENMKFFSSEAEYSGLLQRILR